MSESIFDKIQAHAAQINRTTDQMSKQVNEVEKFLASCGVGINVDISIRTGLLLGYKRSGNRFRLVVGEQGVWKPWSDCTRNIKVETFTHLPDLLSRIANILQQKVRETEITIGPILEAFQEAKAEGLLTK